MKNIEKLQLAVNLKNASKEMEKTLSPEEVLPEVLPYFLQHWGDWMKDERWKVYREGFTNTKSITVHNSPSHLHYTILSEAVALAGVGDTLLLGPEHGLEIQLNVYRDDHGGHSLNCRLRFKNNEALKEALEQYALKVDFSQMEDELQSIFDRAQRDYASAEKRYTEASRALKHWKAFKQEINVC